MITDAPASSGPIARLIFRYKARWWRFRTCHDHNSFTLRPRNFPVTRIVVECRCGKRRDVVDTATGRAWWEAHRDGMARRADDR